MNDVTEKFRALAADKARAQAARSTISSTAGTTAAQSSDREEDGPEATAPAFPIECLPSSIQALSRECARVLSVPVAMPAVCCLAVVSASIGSRLRVRSINGKTTPGNIMVLIAAETGTGKSETHRVCMAPFNQCQEREKELWRDTLLPDARAEVRLLAKEIKQAESKASAADADRSAIKRDIARMEAALVVAEAQMKQPFYHASDFTTPELIKLLCRMDGQLFATSPDAKNFVDMVLGKFNEGGTDEEVYLKAFSLESIDRHRVGDGSAETPEACVAGLWLTQPDKLERLLAQRALSEGGLLPRLLMMTFSCPPLRVSTSERGISADTLAGYHQLITGLFDEFRLCADVLTIDADEAARKVLVDYHNAIADRRELELRDVTGFAARWGEYAWRLALVVHAATHGEDAASRPLSLDAARAGIMLAEWFASQQLEVLSHGRLQATNERHAKVMALFAKQPEIVARDVYRASITPRGNPELATALLDEMVTAGLLQFEDRPTAKTGHVQRVYRRASK
ncbi:MAG: DUF3987 domain-containing protein [Roseimicrobium sp.]